MLASSEVGKLSVSLRVAPDSRTLCFFPIDSQGYAQNHLFGQLAAPGDSIRKSSNSDTLYLLKNGRAYLFTAKKPDLYLSMPLE